ncbi:CRISPR-associated ring nuclease Crn3/Csx3 [Methanosalsum natronophilum]|uniref:CRISPR-associated ring nuclease Crn3/Csx3 n=1 Tax=Methanosalsum natronophilum TaxID=768733 RepID=UPI002169A618|nr:CRISPR-associated ring nuclease Crn3/Csx3 [Methanosalsum natronophilum]MCS3924838.1 CRISPR-associated protein Csx3 [Methanosalsum natronophilum]
MELMSNTKIKFNVTEKDMFSLVEFETEEALVPEDLSELEPPKVPGSKGVIISGRGPVWLYCYLTHFYHPTRYVATYDPRLDGGIVVESHTPGHKVGSIINLYP